MQTGFFVSSGFRICFFIQERNSSGIFHEPQNMHASPGKGQRRDRSKRPDIPRVGLGKQAERIDFFPDRLEYFIRKQVADAGMHDQIAQHQPEKDDSRLADDIRPAAAHFINELMLFGVFLAKGQAGCTQQPKADRDERQNGKRDQIFF